MGFLDSGGHAFAVVLADGGRTRYVDGELAVAVVEAVSWAQYVDDDGGNHLVLSTADGEPVEHFLPGEWSEVHDDIIDLPARPTPEAVV